MSYVKKTTGGGQIDPPPAGIGLKIDGDTKQLNSFIAFLINWNLDNFPNFSVNFLGKNDRLHFGNPETSTFRAKMILYNYVYEIILHGTKTIFKSSFNSHVYWVTLNEQV